MVNKLMYLLSLTMASLLSLGCGSDSPDGLAEPTPVSTPAQPEQTNSKYQLCNANATSETRQVWNVLTSLYGQKIISGVVANVDWNIKEAENVQKWTGKYPAINVFDFINIHASKDVNKDGWLDYSDLSAVEGWWQQGGLVGCMWHWNVRANNGSDMTCSPGEKPGETSFDASKVDDTSSAEYKQMVHDIDQVAGYLKTMQQKGIPVIWRPLHEAAGNTYDFEGGGAWFWWGAKGPEVYKKLWQFMYNRLVNYHKLNNLIWVWTSQVEDNVWYPGDQYVDVVGRDNYYALQYPLMKEYKKLSELYPNKLITLAECGNGDEVQISPLGKIWNEGSRWSWYMTWYDYNYNAGNSDDHQFAGEQWWQEAFSHDYVVTREEMKNLLNK